MALFPRLTMWFNDNYNSGWSETYYGASATDLTTFATQANILALRRAACLKFGPTMVNARVSFDDTSGDSLLLPLPRKDDNGLYNPALGGSGEDAADFSFVTLLIRMEAGSLYRKSLYMAGVPDQQNNETYGQGLEFTAAWLDAYQQFETELESGRWAIKALSKDISVSPIKTVSAFTNQPNVGTLTCVAHGFVAGDKVRVFGGKFQSGVTGVKPNGIWYVGSVIDADNFTLMGWSSTNTGSYIQPGKVRKQVYISAPITAAIIRRVVNHKRGKPYGSPVGRRHALRKN
jgi:hypothetical protein